MTYRLTSVALISSLGLFVAGCESLPGDDDQKIAALNGSNPSATDAVATENNYRTGNQATTGVMGAEGSFIIGQQVDKNAKVEAQMASDRAQKAPATPAQARQSATADLNKDGFVTLDEVIAMRDAGLDDQEMTKRLHATGQAFKLTQSQEDYLINHGVTRAIVNNLRSFNQSTPAQALPTPPTSPTRVDNQSANTQTR